MSYGLPTFQDRSDAGRRLAAMVSARNFPDPVVYALPRGGVPVALEIARALRAPLDVILVRKIGAPGQPELAVAAVVDGDPPQIVVNASIADATGADEAYIDAARRRELAEIARRRDAWLGGRRAVSPRGRTAIVVDDGLATGATAKAALRALRAMGAERTVLAIPVAPASAIRDMEAEADEVICDCAAEQFWGVGAFYEDFHQMTDAETLATLREAWDMDLATAGQPSPRERDVAIPPRGLRGDLVAPAGAKGLVLFAHGSGSSRLSPRNRTVAAALNTRGLATLLLDLLTPDEADDRDMVFDVANLAERLVEAISWLDLQPELSSLPLGLFGASTGAAAALLAAAWLPDRVRAVVSRGGRPDLVDARTLAEVKAPTLLIVGAADYGVIELNEAAFEALSCEKTMKLVPRASHLFEEPGALDQVIALAGDWFEARLPVAGAGRAQPAGV